MFDEYYTACEDALRAQAARNPLGVYAALSRAASIRDTLLSRATVRLEYHTVQMVLSYWEATLESLPYAQRTGVARLKMSPLST